MTLSASPVEVVFIDGHVKDSSVLLNGIDPGTEVHVLDASRDGLAQMADILKGRSGIDAIHILSHGQQGAVQLGMLTLNATNLQDHAADLATIGAALDTDADILLYGCNVAAGSDGAAFVTALAQATQADIAASTDLTGTAAQGGNWVLERQTGDIGTQNVIGGQAQLAYDHLLVLPNGVQDVTQMSNIGMFLPGFLLSLPEGDDMLGGADDPAGRYLDPNSGMTGTFRVSADDVSMGSFDLTAISFAKYDVNGAFTVTVTGTKADSSTVQTTFSTADGSTSYSLGNYASFTGIVRFDIQIRQDGPSSLDQNTFDSFTIANAVASNPTVTNVSSSAADGAHKVGDVIAVTVQLSKVVLVTGTPQLTLETGSTDRVANYASGSGTNTLTFNYTVQAGDTSADLDYLSTSALALNGGTIKDIAWNNAILTLPSPGAAGSLGANKGLVIDGVAPTVTDSGINISGGSGTGGAFKIGDTVTATWNNTAGGDNNTDISSVTVDFSAFGGGAAVAASNSGGTWTATYTLTAGAIDGTNKNVSVTATDNAGNTRTTADTANATVDNIAPTVSDANITLSGASGTGGAFKTGDSVTATWNNTAGGDNNADVTGVTVDFSAFGGGAAVAASNSGGTWTATYTVTAGAIDGTNKNVSVTATDNAGNTRTTADTTNATVDNIAPTVSDANITLSGASGTGGAFKIGDTVTATWNNTAGGDNNADVTGVTVDFSAFGGGSAVVASNSGGTWTASYVITAGAIDGTNKNVSVTATDNAGNTKTTGDTTNATVDNIAPAITFSGLALSADTGTSSSDFTTNTAAQTITATLSAGLGGGDIVYGSLDNGATWTNITAKVSGTTLAWNGAILSGSNTLKLKVTDSAGNDGAVASKGYVLDTGAPTITFSGLALSADTGTSSSDFTTNTAAQTITATLSAGLGGGDIVYGSLDNGATWTNITAKVSGTTLAWNGAILSGSNTLKLKVTDSAGNDGTVASKGYVLDTGAPTITFSALALSADTGASSTDFITSTAAQTISATLSAGLDAGDTVWGSLNNGANWTNITAKVSGTTLAWDGATLAGSNTLLLKVTDSAGNDGTAASKAYVLDTTAPTITSVAVPANSSYTAGQSLLFTLILSETVTVTGTDSSLSLDIGGVTRQATYLSDTANTITYRYIIQPGETDTNGISVGTLILNTTTVRDALDNNLVTTLNSVGSTAAVLVDTTAPAAPSTPILAAGSDSGASNADRITNATTPVITGTAEAGATVTLYDTDGTTVLGTAVATGGNWNITSTTLAAGAHTLTAKATDAAGNTGAASGGLAISIDAAAPAAPAITAVSTDTGTAGDRITSDTTLVLSGTAEANSTVTVSRTGLGAIGTTTADGTGNWSYNYTGTVLADGSHTFTATATDVAGNVSAASADFVVTVDTTAPSAPSTPDLAVASDTGSSGTDNVTSVTTPVITGTAEAGATVTLYDTDGTTVLGTAVATGGNWSITASTLAAGAHTLTAKATDAAGNTSAVSSGLTLTIDTAAPAAPAALALAAASDSGVSNADRITSVTTPVITGTAEADATVTLYDTDGTTVLGTAVSTGGAWSITTTTLLAGAHTLTTKAIDAAGNLSAASTSMQVTIDTSAPQLSTAHVDGTTLTLSFTESVYASNANGMSVMVNGAACAITAVAGSATNTLTLTLASAVESGQTVTFDYAPTATASELVDAAGNEMAALVTHAVTNATAAPPAPTPTPPADDHYNIPTAVEDAVPGLPRASGGVPVAGDGNGDGIADSQQAGVTSLTLLQTSAAQSDPGNAPPVYVTLVAGSQEGKLAPGDSSPAQLTSVVQHDAPANLPHELTMPLGLLSFSATVPSSSGHSPVPETFSLYVDPGLGVNGFWVQDSAGTWINLASAAYGGQMVMEGGRLRLDFQLADGGVFDTDGQADGSMSVLGAVAHMPLSLVGYAPHQPNGGVWF